MDFSWKKLAKWIDLVSGLVNGKALEKFRKYCMESIGVDLSNPLDCIGPE